MEDFFSRNLTTSKGLANGLTEKAISQTAEKGFKFQKIRTQNIETFFRKKFHHIQSLAKALNKKSTCQLGT